MNSERRIATQFTHPHTAGLRAREFETQKINPRVAIDFSKFSKMEWVSPIGFVLKKDGTIRIYVDYHELNAVTICNSCPIQRTHECIDLLGDEKIFSTLNTRSGCWLVKIAEEHRAKTAFCLNMASFVSRACPFGLKSAPGTFHRAMDVLLKKVKWPLSLFPFRRYRHIIAYVTRTYMAYWTSFDATIRCMGDIEPEETRSFTNRIDFLSHVILHEPLEVSIRTIAAIRRLEHPTVPRDGTTIISRAVQSSRHFVPILPCVAAPLNNKLAGVNRRPLTD